MFGQTMDLIQAFMTNIIAVHPILLIILLILLLPICNNLFQLLLFGQTLDLIHIFMNIAVPPLYIIQFIFFLPIYHVFNLIRFIKRSICSENVAGKVVLITGAASGIGELIRFVKRSICTENVPGKVVLITGAASGIGEQLAYEYARRGSLLVLVDINEENLVQVSNKARSLGSPACLSIIADVSKVEDCERFINEAIQNFGRLDHMVNNAGTGRIGKVEDIKQISDHRLVMDINFWGTANGIHFAIPHLKKSKGKIIVISSVCGWYPLPTLSIYNASKAALISFSETLRTELGSAIGITIVTPGVIKTRMIENQDIFESFIPKGSAQGCAKAIVSGACRGDLYVTEPAWCWWLFPAKVTSPEVMEWFNRLLLINFIEHISAKRKAAKGKISEGKSSQSPQQVKAE